MGWGEAVSRRDERQGQVEENDPAMLLAAREGKDVDTVSPPWDRASHFLRFSG